MTRSEAARINGAKSKGPTSHEGKTRSAQNSRKHGYFAKAFILLAGESVEEYEATLREYTEIYQPRNIEETHLVLDIVNARWRLRRAENDYARLIEMELDNPENGWDDHWSILHPDERAALAADALATRHSNTVLMISRVENACHRIIFKTMKVLRDLRKTPLPSPTEPPPPPATEKSRFEPDAQPPSTQSSPPHTAPTPQHKYPDKQNLCEPPVAFGPLLPYSIHQGEFSLGCLPPTHNRPSAQQLSV